MLERLARQLQQCSFGYGLFSWSREGRRDVRDGCINGLCGAIPQNLSVSRKDNAAVFRVVWLALLQHPRLTRDVDWIAKTDADTFFRPTYAAAVMMAAGDAATPLAIGGPRPSGWGLCGPLFALSRGALQRLRDTVRKEGPSYCADAADEPEDVGVELPSAWLQDGSWDDTQRQAAREFISRSHYRTSGNETRARHIPESPWMEDVWMAKCLVTRGVRIINGGTRWLYDGERKMNVQGNASSLTDDAIRSLLLLRPRIAAFHPIKSTTVLRRWLAIEISLNGTAIAAEPSDGVVRQGY